LTSPFFRCDTHFDAGDEHDDEKKRSELGRGTFATTVRMKGKAGTTLEGQLFAVKQVDLNELKKHGLDVAGAASSVQNEISTLKKLKHVNIIAYHADYRTPKHVCIVMELAAGGSLVEVIASKPAADRILRIMYEMASALHYIHGQSVLHRDIKVL
jgi:serine/threonine protein kinase